MPKPKLLSVKHHKARKVYPCYFHTKNDKVCWIVPGEQYISVHISLNGVIKHLQCCKDTPESEIIFNHLPLVVVPIEDYKSILIANNFKDIGATASRVKPPFEDKESREAHVVLEITDQIIFDNLFKDCPVVNYHSLKA